MKLYKVIITLSIAAALFSACKKEELVHECQRAPIHIAFSTNVNGLPFAVNDSLYDDYLGRKYRVELLKFYLSNWAIEKEDGLMMPIADVKLVDYTTDDEVSFDAVIDTGTYVNLHFGVGLDSVTNASDPASFESSHPLSLAQNTYWSWASKYKFFMLEGRVDTVGASSPDAIFSYHSGFDELYRELSISLQDLNINTEGDTIELQMDLAEVINGQAGVIDFVEVSFSHSETQFEVVETISDNLLNAFTINQ